MADRAKPPRAAELVPYQLLYPAEEAQKATKLVQDEISVHRNQLDRLRLFAAENTDLVNLVLRLPDELSHEIMVPFGKAAFFPGRLIHTNEFLVLLGEGYYADQTAKQMVGVLKRRGQVLDSKVEALDAMIYDLQARAKFYDVTANESGEGMVEIREYEEVQPEAKENSGAQSSASMTSSEDGNMKITVTDEEYAQVLASLDELEKAELAAESAFHDSEDENVETEVKHPNLQDTIREQGRKLPEGQQIKNEEHISKDKGKPQETIMWPSEIFSEQSPKPKLSIRGEGYQTVADGKIPIGFEFDSKDGSLFETSQSPGKSSLSMNEDNAQQKPLQKDKSPAENPVMETSTTSYGHLKAFTGTIVEHGTELLPDLATRNSSQAATSNPSKPVSRFKLQKGR